MKFLGVIPARYASTRFPGKPLVDIAGKMMIQRVYERAARGMEHVWVATDDARIEQAVKGFGGRVVLTSETCPSGTDRCMEAADKLIAEAGEGFDVVINIQGDEPLLHPEILEKLMACFTDGAADIATMVNRVVHADDIFNPNEAKVVFDRKGDALYFSRSPIPYVMDVKKEEWLKHHRFYKHIGIYAFKIDILRKITQLPLSSLERTERLEQNRWLENGFKVKVETTIHESVPVDTPQDIERVMKLLDQNLL